MSGVVASKSKDVKETGNKSKNFTFAISLRLLFNILRVPSQKASLGSLWSASSVVKSLYCFAVSGNPNPVNQL